MFKDREHCYLAAPFFTTEQIQLVAFIENLDLEPMRGGYAAGQTIYSPRNDGLVLKTTATDQERSQVFAENVRAILAARFVLAVIDDFDPGVIFEVGFAYGQGVPILAYSDVPGRGLNVMLAGAADLGFVNGRPELAALFARFTGGVYIDDVAPRNTWAGDIQ